MLAAMAKDEELSSAPEQAEVSATGPALKGKLLDSLLAGVSTLLNKTPAYRKLKPEQIAFAMWYAQPKKLRGSMDAFAERIGCDRTTLYNWMRIDAVMELRTKILKITLRQFTPEVLHNLALRAQAADSATGDIKLFLQYAEDFVEKAEIDTVHPPVVLGFPIKSKFVNPTDGKMPNKNASQISSQQMGVVLGKAKHGKPEKPKPKLPRKKT